MPHAAYCFCHWLKYMHKLLLIGRLPILKNVEEADERHPDRCWHQARTTGVANCGGAHCGGAHYGGAHGQGIHCGEKGAEGPPTLKLGFWVL